MPNVWLLWHTHEFDYGDLEPDMKLIGVYKDEDAAGAARARMADQPGFKEQPGGWHADPHEVGKDHWAEGFTTD